MSARGRAGSPGAGGVYDDAGRATIRSEWRADRHGAGGESPRAMVIRERSGARVPCEMPAARARRASRGRTAIAERAPSPAPRRALRVRHLPSG
jgi:hypothetical protein